MSALVRRLERFRPGRKARGLLPDRLFLGPVFGVQMRVAGRQRVTYLVRFCYAGMLTLIACIGLFSAWMTMDEHGVSNAGSLQFLQTIAPGIVSSLAIFQFAALVLIAPVSLGPSLGDERRTGTLSALLTTPLSALQIVCSRLAAQTAHLIILTLVAAPLLLALRVFGGVPAWIIVAITGLCISTAIVGAALSISLSLSSRRGASAAASAVFCQFLMWIAPPALGALLRYYGFATSPFLGFATEPIFYVVLCPPVMLGMLISQIHGQMLGMPPGFQSVWVFTIAANLVIAGGAVLLASFKLRRMLNVEPAPIGTLLSRRKRKRQAVATANPAGDGTVVVETPVRERASSRQVGDRPVLWREMRQGAFVKPWHGAFLLLVLIGFLVYLYTKADIGDPNLQMPVVVIVSFLILAAGAARPGTAIAGERESRTWETLCTTPLSARAILLGKLAGVFQRQWLLPGVLAFHLVISIIGGVLPWEVIPLVALALGPAMVFQACAGLWFSCQQKKPTSAATLNLALCATLWMVGPMLVAILLGLVTSLDGFRWLGRVQILGCLHPMVMLVSAVNGGMGAVRGDGLSYELPELRHLSLGLFALIAVAQAIAYLGLAWVFWKLSLRRIRTTTARLE